MPPNTFKDTPACFQVANYGGPSGTSDQLLDDAIAQLGDLLDGSGRTAGEGLHLLLDLLALFLFALDVDLPAQQLGCQADVLALLADGEGELGIVDNDFQLLVGQVGDRDARNLGRLQSLLGEGDRKSVV